MGIELINKKNNLALSTKQIEVLVNGKEEQAKHLDINENGEYEVFPDDKKVLNKVSVNVYIPPKEEQVKEITIIENGSYTVEPDEGKALSAVNVEVNTPIGYSLDDLLDGTQPTGKIMFDSTKVNSNVISNFFSNRTGITEVICENCTTMPSFRGCSSLINLYFPTVTSSNTQGLNGTGFKGAFRYDKCFPAMKTLNQATFNGLWEITSITLPASIEKITANAFNMPMPLLTTLYFLGTPQSIVSNAVVSGLTSITDIYVPWAEGEVANAPWGAANATIHYNTKYDENGEPITA